MEIRKILCTMYFLLQKRSKRELTIYVGIAFGCFSRSKFQLYHTMAETRNEENGKKGGLTNSTALVLRSKEVNSIFQCIDESIHLLYCIVKVKTCTSTCIDTKGPMQNLCTMMPWSNCYAMLKQRVTKQYTKLPVLMKIHSLEVNKSI